MSSAKRISFHRLARTELMDALVYYEAERPGVGLAFLDEISRCLKSVTEFPEAAPIVRGAIRKKLLRKFPYALLYSIKPWGIRILAVMNLKRRPFYWAGRE